MNSEDILNIRTNNVIKLNEILDNSILEVCKNNDYIVIANKFNMFSLDLIMEGAQPKPYNIVEKTEQHGILAGFILSENRSKFPTIRINNKIHCLNKYNNRSVLCDRYQNFITGDLDIVILAKRPNYDILFKDSSFNMGYITTEEFNAFSLINKKFTRKIEKLQKIQSEIKIIQHGPLNRLPKISLNDLNFPLKIYYPNGKIGQINFFSNKRKSVISLFNLCNILKKEGYVLYFHPNWKL